MLNNNKTYVLLLIMMLAIGLLMSGCGQNAGDNNIDRDRNETTDQEHNNDDQQNGEEQAYNSQTAYSNDTNPVVTIEMEEGGLIKVELYPDLAPNTVNNFISLANDGYYDGVIFHRVIKGFMIQGGDPLGNGSGGPGYSIKAEFTNSGHPNDLSHERGVISMARRGAQNPQQDVLFYDTAGSQFFIMHEDSQFLDGNYTSFGKVIEGIEVVDAIANITTNRDDKPTTDQVMSKVRVDTKGISYAAPEKIAD